MNVDKIIILARKHAGNGALMESSARHCLSEAVQRSDEGRYAIARGWALRSLSYSVGVFHPDYKRAAK